MKQINRKPVEPLRITQTACSRRQDSTEQTKGNPARLRAARPQGSGGRGYSRPAMAEYIDRIGVLQIFSRITE